MKTSDRKLTVAFQRTLHMVVLHETYQHIFLPWKTGNREKEFLLYLFLGSVDGV